VAVVLTHLVALYAIVAAPWLGRILYQKARRGIDAGDPLAKVRLYRQFFVEQVIGTALVLGLCLCGAIPVVSLGLGAPRSWWLSSSLAIALSGLLLRSGILLQPKARNPRESERRR
jgi:hypothetical protein